MYRSVLITGFGEGTAIELAKRGLLSHDPNVVNP
jgi:hypothetical protein